MTGQFSIAASITRRATVRNEQSNWIRESPLIAPLIKGESISALNVQCHPRVPDPDREAHQKWAFPLPYNHKI